MRPSFLGFIANALIMSVIFVLIIMEFLKGKLDSLTSIYLLAILSIVIGIHSLHHYIEEIVFGFNPLRGRWKVRDEKQ